MNQALLSRISLIMGRELLSPLLREGLSTPRLKFKLNTCANITHFVTFHSSFLVKWGQSFLYNCTYLLNTLGRELSGHCISTCQALGLTQSRVSEF